MEQNTWFYQLVGSQPIASTDVESNRIKGLRCNGRKALAYSYLRGPQCNADPMCNFGNVSAVMSAMLCYVVSSTNKPLTDGSVHCYCYCYCYCSGGQVTAPQRPRIANCDYMRAWRRRVSGSLRNDIFANAVIILTSEHMA